MDVYTHQHNANVSEFMRRRAELRVRRLAALRPRAVSARILFALDGRSHRVEVEVHAPGAQRMIANAEHPRFFGPALREALDRLDAQLRRQKSARTTRRRRLRRG